MPVTGGVCLTKKHRPKASEESPLLLTEGGTASAVTGVEGTRYVLSGLPGKKVRPHIRHGRCPCHLLPRERAFLCPVRFCIDLFRSVIAG